MCMCFVPHASQPIQDMQPNASTCTTHTHIFAIQCIIRHFLCKHMHCTALHTHTHLFTALHTHTHMYTALHTHTHLYTALHTHTHQYTALHTHSHLYTALHTHSHLFVVLVVKCSIDWIHLRPVDFLLEVYLHRCLQVSATRQRIGRPACCLLAVARRAGA
jgi:hypothetical protein